MGTIQQKAGQCKEGCRQHKLGKVLSLMVTISLCFSISKTVFKSINQAAHLIFQGDCTPI